MKVRLRSEIENAIARGYKTFLCGMALGFDMICAEMLLKLKRRYKQIQIIGALPCRNQDVLWREDSRKRYQKILSKLDGTRCIYEKYTGARCMIERNEYMINRSSLLIALFDGQTGGTKRTVEYAKKQGLEIIEIQP